MIKYNKTEKSEERERLPISAVKQYAYCKRRFALMFIDGEWGENYKIIEGDILHEKVDDPFFSEKRKDIYYSRSVPVFSDKLNLYGVADIIEFFRDDEKGVKIDAYSGLWSINPIEYKNGKPEKSNADNLQLCAVALCLEEMFSDKSDNKNKIEINSGEIYYGKIRKRVKVELTGELKNQVKIIVAEINELLDKHIIPPKPENQNCSLCSLSQICMPSIFDEKDTNNKRINKLLNQKERSSDA